MTGTGCTDCDDFGKYEAYRVMFSTDSTRSPEAGRAALRSTSAVVLECPGLALEVVQKYLHFTHDPPDGETSNSAGSSTAR